MTDNRQLEPVALRRKPPSAGRGRKKGELNKVTRSVKEALTAAFEELGGVPSLVKWGQTKPSEFYGIWARLIPSEVRAEISGPGGGPVTILVGYVGSTDQG